MKVFFEEMIRLVRTAKRDTNRFRTYRVDGSDQIKLFDAFEETLKKAVELAEEVEDLKRQLKQKQTKHTTRIVYRKR